IIASTHALEELDMMYASRTRELLAILILVGASGVAGCESKSETTASSDGPTHTITTTQTWKWATPYGSWWKLNEVSWQLFERWVNGKQQKSAVAGFSFMPRPRDLRHHLDVEKPYARRDQVDTTGHEAEVMPPYSEAEDDTSDAPEAMETVTETYY
ncbi:MAG: hypothetical protein K0S65_1975, partial [Labilithrix sp.]|nr:hypothetical protein [Labilithrix sp.]